MTDAPEGQCLAVETVFLYRFDAQTTTHKYAALTWSLRAGHLQDFVQLMSPICGSAVHAADEMLFLTV